MKTLTALLMMTTATAAADIKIYWEASLPIVVIDGGIEPNDAVVFEGLTRGLSKGTVRLRSNGGKIDPAMEIGRQIRNKGWTTDVLFSCQSACALIWAAGVDRILSQSATVGFHQPSIDGKPSILGVARIGAYLNWLGYSDQTIAFAISAPPQEMRWIFNEQDAQWAGISVNRNRHVATAPPKNTTVLAPLLPWPAR